MGKNSIQECTWIASLSTKTNSRSLGARANLAAAQYGLPKLMKPSE